MMLRDTIVLNALDNLLSPAGSSYSTSSAASTSAQTPTASLKGLRVYLTEGDAAPAEVLPPPSLRKYWTRRGIAEWLVERLAEDPPTLVGIDHGFSFPLRYFKLHRLPPDWPTFLDDFQYHWPTNDDHTYVDFIREGALGNGVARMGNARWRRLSLDSSTMVGREAQFVEESVDKFLWFG
jgi:hypothetical protein